MTTRATSFLKTDAVRFNALLERLGIRQLDERKRVQRAVMRAYSEPQRVYHNAAHIMDMLELFDTEWFQKGSLLHVAQNRRTRDRLEAAVWWHDAVYQLAVQRPGLSNERASACWAYTELMTNGASSNTALIVHALVLATEHNISSCVPEAQWIVDLDLAILGADEYHFPLYEAHVAAEYGHVPYPEYLGGRAYFLQNFLDSRDYIYQTELFRDRYEERAQDNVKGLIEQLKSHLKEIERHGDKQDVEA
jgi:predicted metal-dependent HD superfamily phosphohydrolase